MDALELVSGEVVSVRVPLCVLCGARPDVQVLVQFSVPEALPRASCGGSGLSALPGVPWALIPVGGISSAEGNCHAQEPVGVLHGKRSGSPRACQAAFSSVWGVAGRQGLEG